MPCTRRTILATLRWLTGRRRVRLEWLIIPDVDVKCSMSEKFLYISRGLIPRASITSLFRTVFFLHFCISTGLKSCGEYTSPASHRLGICLRKSFDIFWFLRNSICAVFSIVYEFVRVLNLSRSLAAASPRAPRPTGPLLLLAFRLARRLACPPEGGCRPGAAVVAVVENGRMTLRATVEAVEAIGS